MEVIVQNKVARHGVTNTPLRTSDPASLSLTLCALYKFTYLFFTVLMLLAGKHKGYLQLQIPNILLRSMHLA